ncbi:MAG: type II CRISPR RNA-guided endonuclease Cas9 [Desulfovibrionaceae bacterium]
MLVNENVILGLDIGIGSLGWALLEENPVTLEKRLLSQVLPSGEVQQACGVRLVSVPESPKTQELLNVHRRTERMQRRVIARRAQRMQRIRTLLTVHGVEGLTDSQTFHCAKGKMQHNPWHLRKAGLERLLSAQEFACVLLHMAKHRGFKSNSKQDRAAGNTETGPMLKAVGQLQAEIQQAQTTAGAYLADKDRKRNRADYKGKSQYNHTMLRTLLEEESRVLFAAQHAYGNNLATETLRVNYATLAFDQRPLASTADMVGACVFIAGEKRAPRFAPTAERFRLAQRLCTLRLYNTEGKTIKLEPCGIKKVLSLLGAQKGISYKSVRTVLGLPKSIFPTFEGLNYGRKDKNGKEEDPESKDIATRTASCGAGSYILQSLLGLDTYTDLLQVRVPPDAYLAGWNCLDAIAKIISDNDDIETIAQALRALPLPPKAWENLTYGVNNGTFATFKGTMKLSVKAMEAILPPMIAACDYADGCKLAGFDHSKETTADMSDIRNPVVARIVREVRRHTDAIVRTFGIIPGHIHLEFLRDVAKSVEERHAITKGLDERTAERKKVRHRLAELFDIAPENVSGTEMLRFELWRAQEGKCAYYTLWRNTGGEKIYQGPMQEGAIPLEWLRDGPHNVQIDHIFPRSRTFDNSFHNLCLSCVSANQAKGGASPYEWLGKENPTAWHEFRAWINTRPFKKFKKHHFLLERLDKEMEGRFHARNLTDTSYIARLVNQLLERQYAAWGVSMQKTDGSSRKRIFARPGPVTDFLRKEWGVQSLKKNIEGQRINDKHHALDALVLACCSESLLQRVTKVFQLREQTAEKRLPMPLPWQSFREDCKNMLNNLFVSRAERGRTKGALHEATLKAVRAEVQEDGTTKKILYIRKHVDSLKLQDLERIKDAHRCPLVIEALRAWITAGKPRDTLPCLPGQQPLRHVRVGVGEYKSGVELCRGSGIAQADNANQVRTDVYTKNGKFYLVPIYTMNIAQQNLPIKACVSGKDEADWLVMDENYTYCFPLIPDCYVYTEDKKGNIREGYFAGTDRSTASITLSAADSRQVKMRGIGVQNLLLFHKYRIDRMGNRHRVKREKDPRVMT